MMNFDLEIDYQKLEQQLNEHKGKMKSIARRMMGKVGSEIKKETKNTKLKGQVLHKQSGKLFKMVYFKTFKDYSAVIGDKAYYASWHENGNGTLPKRTFLLPVIEDYFNSNKVEVIMDRILKEALEKIYGE